MSDKNEWNDPDPFTSSDMLVCAKCGVKGAVDTSFHDVPEFSLYGGGSACVDRIRKGILRDDLTEHLCRKCRVCGYQWVEKCSNDS